LEKKEETREVLKRAEAYFKENSELREERCMLLEAWSSIELKFGDKEFIEEIEKKQPKKIKKRRKVTVESAEGKE